MVAFHSLTIYVSKTLMGSTTLEELVFSAAVDDDLEATAASDMVLQPVAPAVIDAPRFLRAAAAAAATAAATTTRLTGDLFAGCRASAALRPVTGAWDAQGLPDARPATDGGGLEEVCHEDDYEDVSGVFGMSLKGWHPAWTEVDVVADFDLAPRLLVEKTTAVVCSRSVLSLERYCSVLCCESGSTACLSPAIRQAHIGDERVVLTPFPRPT